MAEQYGCQISNCYTHCRACSDVYNVVLIIKELSTKFRLTTYCLGVDSSFVGVFFYSKLRRRTCKKVFTD
jgi:hypothetical protein